MGNRLAILIGLWAVALGGYMVWRNMEQGVKGNFGENPGQEVVEGTEHVITNTIEDDATREYDTEHEVLSDEPLAVSQADPKKIARKESMSQVEDEEDVVVFERRRKKDSTEKMKGLMTVNKEKSEVIYMTCNDGKEVRFRLKGHQKYITVQQVFDKMVKENMISDGYCEINLIRSDCYLATYQYWMKEGKANYKFTDGYLTDSQAEIYLTKLRVEENVKLLFKTH